MELLLFITTCGALGWVLHLHLRLTKMVNNQNRNNIVIQDAVNHMTRIFAHHMEDLHGKKLGEVVLNAKDVIIK